MTSFIYFHVTKEMALIAGIELSADHVLSPLMTTIQCGVCVGQPEKQILIKRSCRFLVHIRPGLFESKSKDTGWKSWTEFRFLCFCFWASTALLMFNSIPCQSVKIFVQIATMYYVDYCRQKSGQNGRHGWQSRQRLEQGNCSLRT